MFGGWAALATAWPVMVMVFLPRMPANRLLTVAVQVTVAVRLAEETPPVVVGAVTERLVMVTSCNPAALALNRAMAVASALVSLWLNIVGSTLTSAAASAAALSWVRACKARE